MKKRDFAILLAGRCLILALIAALALGLGLAATLADDPAGRTRPTWQF